MTALPPLVCDAGQTPAHTHYDALIIGAGPAGSAAAILLAQRGWSVALIERERFPRRKVCGECISATNLTLLQVLGVAESFRALAGAPLRRVGVWAGTQAITAPLPRLSDSGEPFGRARRREQLDALLLERARALGATLWQPYCAQRLNGEAGAWQCELRRGRAGGPSITLSGAVAIDARGSARPLGSGDGARMRRKGELLGFKANFAGVRLATDLLPVLCFPGGYGGIVLAGDRLATLACCIRADHLQRCRERSALPAGAAVEGYLRAHCAPLACALAGAEQSEKWLAMGPLRPGIHFSEAQGSANLPGLFRIGNAAGEAHPIIGEGISMALQSAAVLSELLLACPQAIERTSAAACAQHALVARYEREWRQRFAPRLRWAACLAQAAMRPALTTTLLPLLRRWPSVLTRCARRSGKAQSLHLSPVTALQAAAGSNSTSSPTAPTFPCHCATEPNEVRYDDARAPDAHPRQQVQRQSFPAHPG